MEDCFMRNKGTNIFHVLLSTVFVDPADLMNEHPVVFGIKRRRSTEEQSLKLALGQPWVLSFSNFIFLASAHEGGWHVLSLTVSSSH